MEKPPKTLHFKRFFWAVFSHSPFFLNGIALVYQPRIKALAYSATRDGAAVAVQFRFKVFPMPVHTLFHCILLFLPFSFYKSSHEESDNANADSRLDAKEQTFDFARQFSSNPGL